MCAMDFPPDLVYVAEGDRIAVRFLRYACLDHDVEERV